jgi:hypothetical protein
MVLIVDLTGGIQKGWKESVIGVGMLVIMQPGVLPTCQCQGLVKT